MTPTEIDRIVQAVAELSDRTSPAEWPEAMLVTSDELRAILRSEAAPAAAPSAQWQSALDRIQCYRCGDKLTGPRSQYMIDLYKRNAADVDAGVKDRAFVKEADYQHWRRGECPACFEIRRLLPAPPEETK